LGGAAGASVPSPFCLIVVGGSDGVGTTTAEALPIEPPLVFNVFEDSKWTGDG